MQNKVYIVVEQSENVFNIVKTFADKSRAEAYKDMYSCFADVIVSDFDPMDLTIYDDFERSRRLIDEYENKLKKDA